MTDRDDARYDRDNLRQVFVQRQRWRWTSHAREHPLNCVDDRLGLCFQIWLDKIKRPSRKDKIVHGSENIPSIRSMRLLNRRR